MHSKTKPVAAVVSIFVLSLGCFNSSGLAETAIGDWGHFISYTPTVYFDNPQGKAFTVKVHVMQWPNRNWRREKIKLRLVGPDDEVILSGERECKDSQVALNVESGGAGVYRLHTTDNVWIWSSLGRSVVWTGVPGMHIMDDREPIPVEDGKPRRRRFYEKRGHLVFQAAVPRRWWFWVPPDVTQFTCRAMRADRCMSQREDRGYFIITPRGQRIRALWGQPPHAGGKDYRREQMVTVPVEPGAAGRFWSLEVSLGDSHRYSNINFSLDGVPPYLSRSPEEWFNPATGTRPDVSLYDDTPFIQSAKTEVTVPKGLDNKMWYIRPSVGSAARMVTKKGPDYRYQDMASGFGLERCTRVPRSDVGAVV